MAETPSPDSPPRRSYRLGPIGLAATGSLTLLLAVPPGAIGQVAPGGLGTRVNGTALGRCGAGVCTVEGGTAAGRTLFHRFSQYDTRSGIRRVDLDSRGRANVVVGVAHPNGSFFGAPLRLSGNANLFWLSPGGLWFGAGGQIQGATSLLLSTAPTLRIGGGTFTAAGGLGDRLDDLGTDPPLDLEALARSGLDGSTLGTGDGPIVLAGGRLSVDRHLLLHSGAGPIQSAPGERMALEAGRSVQLSGGTLQLQGLDIQAGTSAADDLVRLRSGPLVGGGFGQLSLSDGSVRATRVVLEGSGGLALERVEARAGGVTEPGEVQISAGTAATTGAARLRGVSLAGGDITVGARGPLDASSLRMEAGNPGGSGRLQLVAGPGSDGEPSLQLADATGRGRIVAIRSVGPAQLANVSLHVTGNSDTSGVWLSTSPSGENGKAPLELEGVKLSAPSVLLRAAGDLRGRNLVVDADQIFLQAEGRQNAADAGGQLSLQNSHLRAHQLVSASAQGDGTARELQIEAERIDLRTSGDLTLDNTLLVSRGTSGWIQLTAGSPDDLPRPGNLTLQSTHLDAPVIIGRADGSISVRNGSARAGRPGERGQVRLETLPPAHTAVGAPLKDSRTASLQGTALTGGRLLVRSGTVMVGANSKLEAPKGKIQLEATSGNLVLAGSSLDVGVKHEADLRTEVDPSPLGGSDGSVNNTPTIGLFAAGDLLIRDGSRLSATQNLKALREANPTLPRDVIRLTDTSGVVVADAGQSLTVDSSAITADASDNLAGNILLRSQAMAGETGLSIRQSSLSASGGVGSGDIRLNSANGIQIEASRLSAQASHSPESLEALGQPDWEKISLGSGAFQGGEITLTNSSASAAILVKGSQLRAEQSASDGPISAWRLTGRGSGQGFTDIFDDNDIEDNNGLGGIITIISGGGIQITGEQSLLSVNSGGGSREGGIRASGSEIGSEPSNRPSTLEDFGGVIRLINTSLDQPILIRHGASLEARTGPALDASSTQWSVGGAVNAWSLAPIEVEATTIDAQTLFPEQDDLSPYYQGGIAFFSQQRIDLRGNKFGFGPLPGVESGQGQMLVHTPNASDYTATSSANQFSPACDTNCSTSWDSDSFTNFLAQDTAPSIWGFDREKNTTISPDTNTLGFSIKDESFTGNDSGRESTIKLTRDWFERVPERIVFQPGEAPVLLADLASRAGTTTSNPATLPSPEAQAPPPLSESIVWAPPLELAALPEIQPLTAIDNELMGVDAGTVELLVEESKAIPESVASESFTSQEERSSREVIARLRLPNQPNTPLAIDGLQQFLRNAMPTSRQQTASIKTNLEYRPAILQISITDLADRDQVQINHILIPSQGEIRGWQTRTSSADLQESIRAFQRKLSQQDMADDNRAGRALEALLLQPVAADLKRLGINALLLALDRGLQGIPFAALPYANGSVVDHFAITVTPALALTDLKPQAMAQQPRRTVLAGASTFRNGLMPLHMAEQELQQLASLHTDALVLFAGSFQTKTLLSRTREQPVNILHLATHADFSGKGADGARIYTSDGELSLSQLGRELRQGQPEPIDLFVLNACRTAVGDEDKELGIAGLALQAGASSALGNLWYVDDVVTAAFSVQFHRALQQGLSKDQALQKTQQLFRTGQIKVRSHTIINENGVVLLTGLSHSEQIRLANLEAPYFWAGAVLTGRPW